MWSGLGGLRLGPKNGPWTGQMGAGFRGERGDPTRACPTMGAACWEGGGRSLQVPPRPAGFPVRPHRARPALRPGQAWHLPAGFFSSPGRALVRVPSGAGYLQAREGSTFEARRQVKNKNQNAASERKALSSGAARVGTWRGWVPADRPDCVRVLHTAVLF